MSVIDTAVRPAHDDQRASTLDTRASRRLGSVVALVVAAVYFVGAERALDYDGSVTVGSFVRRGSLLDVFRTTYAFNNHPYFSFAEHIVWHAGGRSEAWMRVLPVLCAAAAVGVLTAWCARHWGASAGLLAGAVLAANPLFAQLSRSVRGYSLMVLGCVVATVVLLDSRTRVRRLATLPSLIYVVALGVAIGTQFYAVLVLAAHVAILLAKDRFDVGWRRRTEAVLVIGILPYAGMARQLIFSTRTRSGAFQPRFPLLATRELLGHQYLAVAILGALTVSALATVAVRRRLGPATAAIAVELGIIWVVLHPRDLYPRFLVWLVPAVALAAAWCVSRRPRLAFVVAVAVGAMVLSQAGTWTSDPIGSRQIARIVDDARANGAHPCAAGYSTELLLGYTRPVRSVQTVDQLAGCDFVFAVVDNSAPELRRFGCRFARLEVLRGVSRVVVLSSPRRLDDPTPCALRGDLLRSGL